MTRAAVDVFVGVGSNIEPLYYVPQALELLAEAFDNLRMSNVYQCPAVGLDGDAFVNLVVAFTSHEDTQALQARLREIEAACGRDRSIKRASRSMDLDLLLYGDRIIDEDGLHLPRADILEYAFVLKPMAELAPTRRHPLDGRSYAELWVGFNNADQPLSPVEISVPAGVHRPRE